MFIQSIRQFISNQNSLRDFVDLVNPILSQKQAEEGRKNSKTLLPMIYAFNQLDPNTYPISDKIKEEIEKQEFEFKFEIVKGDGPNDSSLALQISEDKEEVFSKALGTFVKFRTQKEHLYKTSLISLISSAEWFISQILHSYYDKYPESLSKNEKLLSIEDIKSLGGIEDAINYLIDIRIEEILRGSIKDWFDYFKNHLKLSMSYLDKDINKLIEAGLRRNIIIHNNGIVNSLFIKKVPEEFKDEYKINVPLTIEQKYLDNIITLFEKNLILIASELWKKIEPENDSRGELLIEVAYNNILAKRYEIGESLSFFTMNDKKLSEYDRTIASVNYWQAKKWQGQLNEVKTEIQQADFSAKDDKFKLAKYALLDEFDEFFQYLPRVLKAEQITQKELNEWPLFMNIRETDKYKTEYKIEEENVSIANIE